MFVRNRNNSNVVLLVYVDDIILTWDNEDELNNVKFFLNTKLLIKDLGKLNYFLGIEVLSIDKGVCLNQRKYCLELLHEYGMLGCKPLSTPLETNFIVSSGDTNEKDRLLENKKKIQKLIGKLIYLTITRPDISYVVQVLSQYMHKPRKSHLKIAFRLLR